MRRPYYSNTQAKRTQGHADKVKLICLIPTGIAALGTWIAYGFDTMFGYLVVSSIFCVFVMAASWGEAKDAPGRLKNTVVIWFILVCVFAGASEAVEFGSSFVLMLLTLPTAWWVCVSANQKYYDTNVKSNFKGRRRSRSHYKNYRKNRRNRNLY